MTETQSHLPDDIVSEKDISRSLSKEYRNAWFGGLRKFRALRLQAPGIIAEFVLAVIISLLGVAVLFRDIEFGGPIQDLGYTLKIIVVIVIGFWIARRVWRLIGLANRNRCRYVVSNMWNLALGALLIASLAIKILNPNFLESP